MDTSETYIKMCKKAEEIQESFTSLLPPGTFWARESNSYYSKGVTGYNYKRLSEWVILPRQDQLQGMITFVDRIENLLENFFDFCFEYGQSDHEFNDYPKQFTSIEQLWLAFAMKERYLKTWDGKDWISF